MPLPSPASSAAPSFTHEQIRRVILGIALCILLSALDQTVVVPAVPAMAADLHGFGHLSWIVSAYLLTATASTPIYGRLSDNYGRRALLVPALGLFIAASVLCALAHSLVQLIVFRALQGIGGGGLMAMSQAVIADVVSPRERGRYQGYMASMWGIASIAGPVLGGWLTDHSSWRVIFWINLPLGGLALVLASRTLKSLKAPRRRARIDIAGAVLLIAAVTSWLLLLSWGGHEYRWDSAPILLLGAGGLALFGLLAWVERRVASPLLPLGLMRDGVFVRGVAIGFAASFSLFGAIFLLPLFFQLVRGVDAQRSGLLVVPFLGLNVCGAYIAGHLARRIGRPRGLLLGGLAACTLGFLGLALQGRGSNLALPVAAMMLLGFGIGTVMPTGLVLVQNAARDSDVGIATGTLLFLRSLGGAFGSTLAGAVLALSFAARLAPFGLAAPPDLGALRHGGAGLGIPPALQEPARIALAGAFSTTFLVLAGGALLATLLAASLADVELRDSPMPRLGAAE